MSVSNYQERARRIIEFFQLKNEDRKLTINHFLEEGVPERSIINVLKRYRDEGRVEFKKKSGRPATVNNKKNQNRVKSSFKTNPSTSVRNVGQKLSISKSSVARIKKTVGMKTRTKKKRPKYKKNQEIRARTRSKYIYNKIVKSGGNLICIMDDETYVPADPEQVPGREFYTEIPNEHLDESKKVKKVKKFYEKYLVWQAISSNGLVSSSYIQKGTMNSDVYLEECVKKRLIPFIESIGKEKSFF